MNPTTSKNMSRIFALVLPLFVLLIVPAAAKAQTYTPEENSWVTGCTAQAFASACAKVHSSEASYSSSTLLL